MVERESFHPPALERLVLQALQRISRLGRLRTHRVCPFALVGMCVAGTLALSGCQDAQHNPLALALAPEAHGAVLSSDQIPSVPHLLRDQGLGGEGSAEAEAWWESWRLGGEDGAHLRSLVYPHAIQRLYPALGRVGVGELLRANGQGLSSAESTPSVLASSAVRGALERAVELHQEALSALGDGRGEEALLLALRSADALWEVTPERVALDLVERAHAALRRNGEQLPYSQQELTRIRRLLNGAEEALGERDYPLAIRRAYYACQLLGADFP
jgi:hypothetical protein